MRRRVPSLLLLIAAWMLLPAGCPPRPEGDASGTSTGSGGTPSGLGTGFPIPGLNGDGGDDGALDTGTAGPPSTVGGDSTSSDTTSPDALTVRYPGCEVPVEGDFWRAEVLRLVNQERAARGLAELTANPTLEQEATQYACELIFYDYFGHSNPITGSGLSERAVDSGYDYWIIGENLAAGQQTPVKAVADWMASPCHRENVLNPAFTEIGIGIRTGGDYGTYWVQEFGRPFDVGPYDGPEYHDPECVHE